MKKLVNKLSIIFGAIGLIAVPSCNKDFLEKAPIGAISENTLATKSGVNGLLIGAYSLLDQVGGWSGAPYYKGAGNWVFGGIASDDAHAGTYGNLPDAEQFEAYKHNPTNPLLGFKWGELYAGVQRANDVLRILVKVPEGGVAEAEGIQFTAEARFLRAVFHFELVKVFRNVPYVDETVFYSAGNYYVPNTTPIWDKIEADFQYAADNLTETKPQAGRANKWAAKSFLAKSYMFQHKFAEAKPLLEDIIQNGVTANGLKYVLVKFSDNFDASKKNNAESVFAVQFSVKDGSNGGNGNQGDVLNQPLVAGAGGGGTYQPSFSLVNSYKTDPITGLPLLNTFNDEDVKNDQGLKSTDPFTPYTGTLDARLDWTAARRDIPLHDHGLYGVYWILFQDIGGPYGPKKTFFWKKDEGSTIESYGGWTLVNSTNYAMIRFSDVLLWAAEVEVEIGSLMQAETYVNIVRARAADPESWLKTYIDNSDPSKGFSNTPAANYKVGLYNGEFLLNGQDFARESVRFERKLEFAMEGHRFFDLQRYDNGTGYMADVLNVYLQHETSIPGYNYANAIGAKFIKGKHEIYPIPQSEIDVSAVDGKPVLQQNPGW